jgi:2-polyprenyl-6-methoxyphenol hydroxylase-like FAD-dependent oxidoreductase
MAGIKMMVTAYITDFGGIYNLLLSRRWMEPMEAKENFKEKRFTIKGPDGKRLVILPTEDYLLSEDGVTQEEFEEEISEDEIEELKDELRERMGTSAIVVTIVPSENA